MSTATTSRIDQSLYSADLHPIPRKARNWKSGAYLALWVGMCINAATWTLASSLMAMGMNWVQAIMTIVLANLIILIPMLLNSYAGTKHGITFPVFVRSSFGVRGANLPALLRALVGCGWTGIQTWFTALVMDLAIGVIVGDWWTESAVLDLGFIGEQRITLWACFIACAVLQVAVIAKGFDSIRILQQISAPLITGAIVILFVYLLIRSGGNVGPVVGQESTVGWGREFWLGVFPPGLMANIAFWATLSLNMPDFTRFASSQRSQLRGQAIGLPLSMFAFSFFAIFTTSMAAYIYQVSPESLWSPEALIAVLGHPVVIVIGALIIALANFSTNVASNMVGPALDFANAFPKYLNQGRAVILVMVIGTLMLPWRLLESPESYIFVWLGFYGGMTGAIGGIMVVDYWILRRTNLNVPDLFRLHGDYTFTGGWNLRAVAAFFIGAFFAVGGAYSAVVDGVPTGPFPENGFIPVLAPLYDFNWLVSFAVGSLVYLALSYSKLSEYRNLESVAFEDRRLAHEDAEEERVLEKA